MPPLLCLNSNYKSMVMTVPVVTSRTDEERDYFTRVFGKKKPEKCRVAAALEKAHEIRQFEIRLYWQRSLFFWGFDLAFFTAYFLLLTSDSAEMFESFIYVGLALAGLFTTIAWFYVERGSGRWQKNWELHIDCLEYHITGNLHKTILGKTKNFFSLSSIHQDFIIFVGLIWVCLMAYRFPVGGGYFLLPWLLCLAKDYAICALIVAFILVVGVVCYCVKRRWPTSEATLPRTKTKSEENTLHQRDYPKLHNSGQ